MSLDNFEIIIGLEVHAQLATKTKAWCACEIKINGFENEYVCEVCAAHPGVLPVLNDKVVEFAVMAGLATNCEINLNSGFDRKNYFYPDLPKGYQITQFEKPIAQNGKLTIRTDNDQFKEIRITRVQIEEDTGKSSHHNSYSLINLNRAGTPLIEIVSEPDMRSSKEAVEYLKTLQAILVYLDVCKGNMQDGNFRCDVNLSLRLKGEKKFGTRTEVKNLNSFRSVEKAIEYESQRHARLLSNGQKVEQQTLLFDVDKMQTKVLRTKSDADDYRYFAEPDLTRLIITEEFVSKLAANLPELPNDKLKRFVSLYEITEYDAEILSGDRALAKYFEDCVGLCKAQPKKVANWIMVELLRLVNESGMTVDRLNITPKKLADLLNFVEDGTISGKIAKEVFLEMFDKSTEASSIIEAKGLKQNNDTSELENLIKALIIAHPQEVEQLKAGKDRLLGFFVGQVMKATGGQANPAMTSELVKKLIGV